MARINPVSCVGSDIPELVRLVGRALEAGRLDPEFARRAEVRRRAVEAMVRAERITPEMLRRRIDI